ncbi:unnamed protein product [Caenorhabditis brenneri]
MPGSYAPKNRINWKDATNASDTSPSGSKAPPNGFGNKKVSYRPKLTEDDKTKQKANKYSDAASDDSTDKSSSSVGRTDPGAVVTEDFNNTSQTAAVNPVQRKLAAIIRTKAFLANRSLAERKELAPANDDVTTLAEEDFQNESSYSSVNTSILQVPEMRSFWNEGESAGASSTMSSPCRLDTSTSIAVESRSRSAILSQISPFKNDGIEAARMRLKASLATMSIPKKTVACSENSSGSPTDRFPLFGSEVITGILHSTSTLQTAPVNENSSKKLMKKSSVTIWKKKKEVFTPPES